MNLDLHFWRTLLITLTTGSAVLFLAAWLLHLLLRRPEMRKTIWQACLLGLGLLLTLELSGIGGGLMLQMVFNNEPVVETSAPPDNLIQESPFGSLPDPSAVLAISIADITPRSMVAPTNVIWPVALWSVVSLFLLGRILISRICLHLFRRGCRTIDDPDVLQRVRQLSVRLGIKRRVTILESVRLKTPVAFGIARLTVGIPTAFRHEFTAAEQDSVLIHELAHLVGNDSIWRPLVDFIAALWWWNPLVWIARKIWMSQSELAADEASHLLPDGSTLLAECLVRLGRELASPNPVGWSAMAGSGYRSQLGKRVQRLLNSTPSNWQPASRRWLQLTLVFGLTLLLGSGLLATGVANPGFSFPKDSAGQKLNDAWNQSLVARTLALARTDVRSETEPDPLLQPVPDIETIPLANETAAPQNAPLDDASTEDAGPAVPDDRSTAIPAITIAPEAIPGASPEEPGTATNRPSPVTEAAPRLFTRNFRVEPHHFVQELVRYIKAKRPELVSTNSTVPRIAPLAIGSDGKSVDQPKNVGESIQLLLEMSPDKMDGQAANLVLIDYLSEAGVEIAAPKMVYFNERSGIILIRATLEDLEIVRTAIDAINEPSPQVNIDARWVEITQDDMAALGFGWMLDPTNNQTAAPPSTGTFPAERVAQSVAETSWKESESASMKGILDESQYRLVMDALKNRGGVDVLFSPKAVTISGRQTQIKTVEIQTVVTGVNTNADGLFPQTTTMEFGPVLDVIPKVSADRSRIEMNVVTTLTQFNGYQDPAGDQVVYQPEETGKTVEMAVPKPAYKLRQASATMSVRNGDTLVLGGMIRREVVVTRSKVPVLGSIPLVGRLFRSESKKPVRKNLIIFITPTIVDPAGNREQAKR